MPAAKPAGSAAGTSHIVYERGPGAESCPDDRGVRDILAAQLATGSLDSRAPIRVHLVVRAREVSRPAPGDARSALAATSSASSKSEIEGRVELIDAEGRRTWENEQSAGENDCRTLIASLALSLRVAEGALSLPRGGSERPSPPEPPIRVQGVSQPPVGFYPGLSYFPPPPYNYPLPGDVPRADDEPSLPAFRISAASALAIGMAPGTTARFALGLGLVWPGFSVSIEARSVVPSAGHYRGHILRVARWEGSFVPCAGRGILFACGLLSFGGLWTHTTGASHDSGAYFHAGGGARVGVEMEVSSNIGIATYCDVEASFSSNGVVLDRYSAWVESPVQLALSIAITGLFPESRQ